MRSSNDLLKKRADKGDKESQYELGLDRHHHDDYLEALRWYGLAANKGHAFAHNNLGLLHQTGTGVSENLSEAAHHFTIAASAGLKEAQHNLGVLFRLGKGVHGSGEEAVKWFRMAAEQKYSQALFQLASCYEEGVGVEKDFEKAAQLFKQAFLDQPNVISLEEDVNRWHALLSITPGAEHSIPRCTVEEVSTDEGLALIARCAKLPGVPDPSLFMRARLERLVKHAREVAQSYRGAVEQYGRDMLGLNRPLVGLDWDYIDFLREMAVATNTERKELLFVNRELVYRATLEKKLEFFERLTKPASAKISKEEIHLKRAHHFLVSEWIQAPGQFPPLCFFTDKAIKQCLGKNSCSVEQIGQIRKNLGLKSFTELWFHVPAVHHKKGAMVFEISDKRRGHAIG